VRAEELIFSTLGGLVNGQCRPIVTRQSETAIPRIAFDCTRNEDDFICANHPRETITAILELTHKTYDQARALRDSVVSAIEATINFRGKDFDSCDFDEEIKLFVWTLTFELHCDRQ
jgi:hypothetical protein